MNEVWRIQNLLLILNECKIRLEIVVELFVFIFKCRMYVLNKIITANAGFELNM